MTKDPAVYIHHILDSIDLINKYLRKVDENDFIQSIELQDAVIRRFGIIGEAGKKLADLVEDKYPELPWSEMISLRNVIIHDYIKINLEIIWDTANNDLPALRKKLLKILKDFEK